MLSGALRTISLFAVKAGDPALLRMTGMAAAPNTGQFRHASRQGGRNKKDFWILRDWPVGPHKTLPPGVRLNGRVGTSEHNYRHIIHYPEDGKYTVLPLKVTKLAGRHPIHGRKVVQGWRGGSKQKCRWIDWRRFPVGWNPEEDLVERVIKIRYDPLRKPMIALTGYNDILRWQIATDGMKEGDLITTTAKIPENPIKPIEGNGYPLGALPVGTDVCLVQWYPDSDVVKVYEERQSAKIVRKVDDRVIIQRQNKFQFSLDQRCQCVVGRVSIHPLKAIHIGSPNRSRWLGIAPRSGLWQRKSGIHGRKIYPLPPVEEVMPKPKPKDIPLRLNLKTEGIIGMPAGRKRPFNVDLW